MSVFPSPALALPGGGRFSIPSRMIQVAKIKPDTLPDSETVKAIYAYHKAQPQRRGARLGASIIGGPCDRALWYSFRWAGREEHDGRLLRLFERGQVEEPRVVKELRGIGCEVMDKDPSTGEQVEFSAVGGHLVCKLDGAVLGVPEAPKTWHVLEVKTHNAKSFAALQSKGIASKPTHLAQCAVAMRMSGMTRCLYIAVNKDTDELFSERIRAEDVKSLTDSLMARAKFVVDATVPPEKISDDANHWECKWCSHRAVCHEGKVMDPTCRSCCHSTPTEASTWTCELLAKGLSAEEQEAGCDEHRFIPLTIGYAAYTDAGTDENGKHWVEYRNSEGGAFRNGPGPMGYSSKELAVLPKELVGADHAINHGREAFGAKVVEFTPAAKKIIANASQSTRTKNLRVKAELGEKMTIEEERAEFAAWTKAVNLDMDKIGL